MDQLFYNNVHRVQAKESLEVEGDKVRWTDYEDMWGIYKLILDLNGLRLYWLG